VEAVLADEVVTQLMARLGWSVREQLTATARGVDLRLPKHLATVLVIDDNEGLAYLFERYLADQACQVVAANDGQEGLNTARTASPDVIVLDVMMPDIDGWELLQRLRADPATAGTPIVICSVINDPELALSLGASAFLVKPFDRTDVLAVLHRLDVN
jgi:CheY-like chemotaxis protein